ncbi:MAG: M48 family metalloprotease [Rhodospirillaceae bacterium]|nr:M48 family metalloprotease [Rhodospirillaceae bacterium]
MRTNRNKQGENAVRNIFTAALAAGTILLAGCATPHLDIAEPDERQKAEAEATLQHARIGPPRNVAADRMVPTVRRVIRRVRLASHAVCTDLKLPEERCKPMLEAKVFVHTKKKDINAFADEDDNVGVYGGLVRHMGTDAEIAGVLAHEFAHVMYGHVESKKINAFIGGLILGGLAAAASAAGGGKNQQLVRDSTSLGWEIGATAYSPEMEIEADRTAVYILRRAGFPVHALQSALLRMNRARAERSSGTFSGTVGFLETHPSNDRRHAHLISAMEDVRAGKPLKPVEEE